MVRGRGRLLAWVLCLCLCGCDGDLMPKAMNIAELRLMRTMAVDRAEDGKVKVTVVGDLQKESTGGEASPPIVVTREGKTVFGAATELQRTGEGNLEFGHLEECLMGEDAARQGIGDLTDYLERDAALRTGTKLFVIREDTGEHALNQTASAQLAPTDWLTTLSEDKSLGGDRWPYLLRNYMGDTEDNGAALLPVVTLQEKQQQEGQGQGQQEQQQQGQQSGQQEQPESELVLSGLAWFREDRLAGYLSQEETRGACLLTGNNQKDAFEVPLSGGGLVGISLVRADCSYDPVFAPDGTLVQVVAKVSAKGKLNQVPKGVDPQDQGVLEEIRQGFLSQVQAACQTALERSQKENSDFLHIRRALVTQHGFRQRQIQQDWEQRFPELKLTVEVQGEIGRSYDTDRPGVPGEG